MSDNPYQTPDWQSGYYSDTQRMAPVANHPGMVGHVRTLAILCIVQGSLELMFGLLYVVLGFVMPQIIQAAMRNNANPPANAPDPQVMNAIMMGVYVGGGVVTLLAGSLCVFAGIRNLRFRGRLLTLVAVVLGMGSVFTCYCAPTAIALAVYAFIVMLNPQVIAAFEIAKQGLNGDQILAAFYGNIKLQQPMPPGSPPQSTF